MDCINIKLRPLGGKYQGERWNEPIYVKMSVLKTTNEVVRLLLPNRVGLDCYICLIEYHESRLGSRERARSVMKLVVHGLPTDHESSLKALYIRCCPHEGGFLLFFPDHPVTNQCYIFEPRYHPIPAYNGTVSLLMRTTLTSVQVLSFSGLRRVVVPSLASTEGLIRRD